MVLNDQIETEFPGGRYNLNPGTLGTPARSVVAAMEAFRVAHEGWPLGQYVEGRAALSRCRSQAAALWKGMTPALGHGTTAQLSALVPEVARAFGKPSLLTTTDEHEGAIAGFLRHPDFSVEQVSPDRLAERAKATKPDLILVSQVLWTTGECVDVPEIVAASPDSFVINDVAQVLGNGAPAMVGDVVVGSLHKWLAGPAGTGVSFFSERALAKLAGTTWAGHATDPDSPAAWFEPAGAQDFSTWAGLSSALNLYERIGIAEAKARSLALSLHFGSTLAAAAPGTLFLANGRASVEPAVTSGGFVVLPFPDRDPYPVYQSLELQRVHVKCIKQGKHQLLRLGIPWWETEERLSCAAEIVAHALRP